MSQHLNETGEFPKTIRVFKAYRPKDDTLTLKVSCESTPSPDDVIYIRKGNAESVKALKNQTVLNLIGPPRMTIGWHTERRFIERVIDDLMENGYCVTAV